MTVFQWAVLTPLSVHNSPSVRVPLGIPHHQWYDRVWCGVTRWTGAWNLVRFIAMISTELRSAIQYLPRPGYIHVYGIRAVPLQLVLHIRRPAYPPQSATFPIYKVDDGTLVMSTLTLLENGFSLPWKLPVSVATICYRNPKANRLLLLLPCSNHRIQIPIPRGSETLPAAMRPVLV